MKFILLAVGALVVSATNCDTQSQSRLSPPAFVGSGVPREACTDLPPIDIVAQGKVVVIDTTLERDHYQAGRIVDAAPDGLGGMYLLDGAMYQVAHVDSLGKQLAAFGRKGHGPGEFADPQALSFRDNRIFVLDSNGRVSVFSAAGIHEKDINTWVRGQDLAILPNSNIVVAEDIRPFGSEDEGVVVFDSLGRKKAVLVKASAKEYGNRPFTGPTGTTLRVFAGNDGRVAVAYTTDNSVDVFEGSRLSAKIRSCLPKKITDYYRRLYVHNVKSRPADRAQAIRIMINAVYLDRSGDIFVAAPGGWDRTGDVTVYDKAGIPRKVIQFADQQSVRFAPDAEFVDRTHLLTWDGSVFKWTVAIPIR